jgi:hypothetical protein
VIADSHGDAAQATKILTGALARDTTARPQEGREAEEYLAELRAPGRLRVPFTKRRKRIRSVVPGTMRNRSPPPEPIAAECTASGRTLFPGLPVRILEGRPQVHVSSFGQGCFQLGIRERMAKQFRCSVVEAAL